MQSEIAQRLKLMYSPVAIFSSNEKPQGAQEFKEGSHDCVIALLTAAAKGSNRAVFSRTTFGCDGGGLGLGLLTQPPKGMEYFLSTGKEGPASGPYETREPAAFKKTPELAKNWLEALPNINLSEQYVVFAPLSEVDAAKEEPKVVVFYANPDQLTALIVMANYGRPGYDNVIAPWGAGCMTSCLIAWNEANKETPRAVIGMADVSVRPHFDADLLSFSVPYAMFKEMEDNVPGSFLDREEWKLVAKRIPDVK